MSDRATRDAYGTALVTLGKENRDVVVLDADLSKSTKTYDFSRAYPERFFNMGIAEQNLMAVAAGLARENKIPFASTFAMFATGRAYEIIRNSICYPRLNVKIAATHAGITVGEDGASHQSVEDISLMRSIPNMVVLVPADGTETEKMVEAAAAWKGPVYIRMGRSKVPGLFDESYEFAIGRATVLKEGSDVTLLACGIMTAKALEAAGILAQEGISAEVINVGTIKPLDRVTILTSLKKTGRAVTAEEHSIIGGLGSAVSELTAEELPVPVLKVGIRDTFGESGNPEELLVAYGLTAEEIAGKARAVCAL